MFGKKKDKEKESKDQWVNPYGTPLDKQCATSEALPPLWIAAFDYLHANESTFFQIILFRLYLINFVFVLFKSKFVFFFFFFFFFYIILNFFFFFIQKKKRNKPPVFVFYLDF
jgi:hypothetical protein